MPWKIEKQCIQCGNTFTVYASQQKANTPWKLCSAKCRGIYQRKSPATYTCQRCGATFTNRVPRGYCSRHCANNRHR